MNNQLEFSLSTENDLDNHYGAAIYTPISCEMESDFENQARYSAKNIAFNSGIPSQRFHSLTPDLSYHRHGASDSDIDIETNLVIEVLREDSRLFSVDLELKSIGYSVSELLSELQNMKRKYFTSNIDMVSIEKTESGVTHKIMITVKKDMSNTTLLVLVTYLVSLTKSILFAYYILIYFDFLDESNLPSLSYLISLCIEELPHSNDSMHFPFLKALFAMLHTISHRCPSPLSLIPDRTLSSFALFIQQLLSLLLTLQIRCFFFSLFQCS